MIGRFYMLSDEDKKDIVDHKANYTVEEIEEMEFGTLPMMIADTFASVKDMSFFKELFKLL